MDNPKKYGVIVAVLVASAFLAYNGLSTYVNPYISVTQILNRPDRYIGRDIQVIGDSHTPVANRRRKGAQSEDLCA